MNLTAKPKGPVVHMDELPKKPRLPEPLTLYKMLTEDETKIYRLTLLKSLGTNGRNSKFREYFDFYAANQSGDFKTMNQKNQSYVEKMIKDIEERHQEELRD